MRRSVGQGQSVNAVANMEQAGADDHRHDLHMSTSRSSRICSNVIAAQARSKEGKPSTDEDNGVS
jgi:hypothetical protein